MNEPFPGKGCLDQKHRFAANQILDFEKFRSSERTIPPRCLPIESYFVGGSGEDEVALSDRITRPGGLQPWSTPSSDPIVPRAGQ
jgi:hypothetical protein